MLSHYWLTLQHVAVAPGALIEYTATLLGFLCVWYYIREHMLSWPTGFFQTLLFTWIFFDAKLYSDVLLQLVNIALVLYGWIYWTKAGPKKEDLPISRLSFSQMVFWIIVMAAGTGALGYVMHTHTDAALPYWDAAIAVMSLVAQFLIGRKVLENWLIWIVVDVIAIGVYLAKDLRPTSVLYAAFLVMATTGFFAWAKTYRNQQRPNPSPDGAAAA